MKTAFVVTPPAAARNGNRVTALRWAKRLRELGWHVRVANAWDGEACDALIALHARKSFASIARFAAQRPSGHLVVALTGTDLYGDIHTDADAQTALRLAHHLILLQPLGITQLPPELHTKVVTLRQSATAAREPLPLAPPGVFSVCILAHLRPVKGPLLAAEAVRLLPADSRVRVFHLGAALEPEWVVRAEAAAARSGGRWVWLGARPRSEAMRLLAGASLLAVTSRAEGGANAVTEAIAAGVPVISTRIDGSIGILGASYPGFFEVDDAADLSGLLRRCETDSDLYGSLRDASLALQPLVDPAAERAGLAALVGR